MRFGNVYELVKSVPKGKVTTYGIIAKKLSMSPRVVGYALHVNPDSNKTPCHRVVNRNGRVAPGFAFGGPGIQKILLEKEGVRFKDETHLDLNQFMFEF